MTDITTLNIPASTQLYLDDGKGPGLFPSPILTAVNTTTAFFGLYFPVIATSTTSVTVYWDLLFKAWEGFPTLSKGTTSTSSTFALLVTPNATGSEALTTTQKTLVLLPSDTLYVAFTAQLPTQVDASTMIQSLQAAYGKTPMSIPTASSTASIETTSSPSSTTPGTQTPSGIAGGDLAGVIIGTFIGALIIGALLAWFCLERRRNSRQHLPQGSKMSEMDGSRELSKSDETQVFPRGLDVAGWQKHLPQEKDDATLAHEFQSLFEHIELHIEGFYETKPGRHFESTLSPLTNLTLDEFPSSMQNSTDVLPLLEGTLMRWVVHRVSLRSEPDESLLPSEYTQLPAKNKWHMESDGLSGSTASESKKGFQQAFAEWRVRTGFLHPQVESDQVFQHDLARTIDNGVQEIEAEFSPWEIFGKKVSIREESLRKILHRASEVGIRLFTQSSTYAFDWSSQQKKAQSVVLAPALVKRLDEHAETLYSSQILVPAKICRI